jgi:hypothetical protein
MKVGDLVMFESDAPYYKGQPGEYVSRGIVIAKLPSDYIQAPAVSVLWSSGEITERTAPRILKVINAED